MRAWTIAGLALCLAACNREVEVRPTFDLAHGPGPVERVECRQGECYWTQRQSTAVLSQAGEGIRLKVVGRAGSSAFPIDGEPPLAWASGVEVEWHPEIAYFFCSLTRPAMLREADGEFLLDRLDLHTPPGVEGASANEYMAACHSLAPGKWDEGAVTRLGYAKGSSDQARYPTLEAGLGAMGNPNPSS